MSYPPQAPYSQQYAPPPPPPVQPTQPVKSSGLAVAALVLGIIALVLSWVPIINNMAAVLAVVGLALGIPALVQARKGARSGKGMAIAGVVTSVVAIVVVFATQAFYSNVIDEVQNELDDLESSSQDAGSPAEPADAATDEPTVEFVALGTPATVGDYEVTLDAVQLDGNAIAAAGNQFNDAPTGQYVVIQLTTTYVGTDEGFPGMDLTATFHGADKRQYSDSDCAALLPDDAMNAPTLNPGGADTFQFCMDVPPAAIAGGQLSIEETISWDAEPVFFALA
ncbi:DUF4190 domain-containing protein [Blastococcus atacamensis]|uniref:DUF4190 domain-containing protein n=1 Tax=Blastococcus atacamensis TaxID=2070508 RepID=UPI001300103B|nr:DUF4190 domain-containing protein [Blastococcus atacamensis]